MLPSHTQGNKAPSSRDEAKPQFSTFAAWSEHVQKGGLLAAPDQRPPDAGAVPQAQCGISLFFLLELSRQLDTYLPPDATTATVVSKVIIPYTGGQAKSKKSRLYDWIPPVHVSRPSTYVVHAWGMPFKQMVAQLIASHDADPDAEHVARVFVWLDIVAIAQQLELAAFSDLPSIKETAATFVGGMVVVIDKKHLVLTRTWCMYEIWMFIYHNQVTKLKVCLPENEDVDWLMALEAKCKQLDVTSTRSTAPDDRVHILSEIRKSVGMKIMQRTLNEALLLGIRKSLRWSGRFEDFALYCTLLLRSGEHAALQDALHGLSDLNDESVVSLEDVQKVFDAIADPTIEALRYEQFKVLIKDIGLVFDTMETKDIFSRLSQQCSRNSWHASVDKHTFFEWYRSLEKAWVRVDHVKQPAVMTAEALVLNLRRMQMYLGQKELPHLAEEFRAHLQQHYAGLLLPLAAPLTTAEFRGNWLVVSNDVAWRLHTHDYRGATALLHSLLMWNGDIIEVNPNTLPRMDTKTMALKPLCKVLLQYMEIFIMLLKQHPRTNEHTAHQRFYATCTEQLLAPEAMESLVKAHRKGHVSHTQVIISRAVKELERNAVVQNMIRLKYGNNRPMDGRHLVVEAELSVAELLCMTKGGPKPAGALPYANYLCHDRDVEDKVSSVISSNKMMQAMRLHSKHGVEGKSVLLQLGAEAEAFFREQQELDQAEEGEQQQQQQQQQQRRERRDEGGDGEELLPLRQSVNLEEEGDELVDLQSALQAPSGQDPGQSQALKQSPFLTQTGSHSASLLELCPVSSLTNKALGTRYSDTGQGTGRLLAPGIRASDSGLALAAPEKLSARVSARQDSDLHRRLSYTGSFLPHIGSFDKAVGQLNPNPLLRMRQSKGSAASNSSPRISPFSSPSPPPAGSLPTRDSPSSPTSVLTRISQATADAATQAHQAHQTRPGRSRSISLSGSPFRESASKSQPASRLSPDAGGAQAGGLPRISANQSPSQRPAPTQPPQQRLSLMGLPSHTAV